MLLSTTALCAGGRVARKWLLRVWGLSQRVVTAKHYVFMLALLQYLNVFLPSHAAEVTQIKSTLVIEGKIVAEDVARVEMLLAKNESAGTPIRNLELSSQGGDLNAAIAIGRLVRSRWMSTRARGFVFGQHHVFCDILGKIYRAGCEPLRSGPEQGVYAAPFRKIGRTPGCAAGRS